MGIKELTELLEGALAMAHNNFMHFKDGFSRSYGAIGMGRPIVYFKG